MAGGGGGGGVHRSGRGAAAVEASPNRGSGVRVKRRGRGWGPRGNGGAHTLLPFTCWPLRGAWRRRMQAAVNEPAAVQQQQAGSAGVRRQGQGRTHPKRPRRPKHRLLHRRPARGRGVGVEAGEGGLAAQHRDCGRQGRQGEGKAKERWRERHAARGGDEASASLLLTRHASCTVRLLRILLVDAPYATACCVTAVTCEGSRAATGESRRRCRRAATAAAGRASAAPRPMEAAVLLVVVRATCIVAGKTGEWEEQGSVWGGVIGRSLCVTPGRLEYAK